MLHHPTCSSPIGSQDVLDVVDGSHRLSDKLGFHHSEGSTSSSSYITSTPFFSESSGVDHANRTSSSHADSAFSTILKPAGRRLVNSDDLPHLPFLLDSASDTTGCNSLLSVSPTTGSSLLASLSENSELADSGCFSGFSDHDSQTCQARDFPAGNLPSRVSGETDVELVCDVITKSHQKEADNEELTCIDFINELSILPHVLRKLLSYLSEDDLLRGMRVSRTWHDAVHLDANSRLRVHRYKLSQQPHKENIGGGNRPGATKRGMTPAQQPLDNIQSTSSEAEHGWTSSGVARGRSRFEWFCEEASKLSGDERLSKCPRCESPARAEPIQGRARCTASRCDFDYCLRCQKPFHGSSACKKASSRGSEAPTAVGSQRSRKNLRRL